MCSNMWWSSGKKWKRFGFPYWGTQTRCIHRDDCYWPLSSVMHINDDIDWPVLSLMLSFHDLQGLPLRRLPSTVPSSMILGHGRTIIVCNAWWLTVKAPEVRQVYWPVALHICLFYALCMICRAFSCSICYQKPGFTLVKQQIEISRFTFKIPYCIHTTSANRTLPHHDRNDARHFKSSM